MGKVLLVQPPAPCTGSPPSMYSLSPLHRITPSSYSPQPPAWGCPCSYGPQHPPRPLQLLLLSTCSAYIDSTPHPAPTLAPQTQS